MNNTTEGIGMSPQEIARELARSARCGGPEFPPADHECREPLTDAALAAGIRAQVERLTVLMNIARGRGIQVNFGINDAGVPGGGFNGTVDIQKTEVL